MLSPIRMALAAALLLAFVPAAYAAPAMWQVSDGDSKVWLFGSMHVLKPGATWRTPVFETAVKDAEQVYFEADIGPLGQFGIMLKGITMAFSGARPTWAGELTSAQSATLSTEIAPLGLTIPQLSGYAPWLAESVIEDKVMQAQGYRGDAGVDATLQTELPKERKAFFESAGLQMDMLGSDPEATQVSRLLTSVGELDKLPAQLDGLSDAWLSGKTDDIAAKVADDPTLDKAFEQTMLFDRNRKWATAIGALLAGNHQDLIVVGAAHLVGDGSVVDLLGKAGFTVERIQ